MVVHLNDAEYDAGTFTGFTGQGIAVLELPFDDSTQHVV